MDDGEGLGGMRENVVETAVHVTDDTNVMVNLNPRRWDDEKHFMGT